jgi:PAS domain S-box-containing protein
MTAGKYFDSKDVLHITTNNNIVIEINEAFLNYTGFSREEILFKPISAVLHYNLKLNSHVHNYESLQDRTHCVIFTKALEPREMTIVVQQERGGERKTYTLIEEPNSRLEQKFLLTQRLIADNHLGVAIYNAADFILLKVNKKYADFVGAPYQNIIGRSIREFVPDFTQSSEQRKWEIMTTSGETLYLTEAKGAASFMKDRYWDRITSPIVEDGKVKYIVSIIHDVTERVCSRIKNEEYFRLVLEQAQQLQIITNNMNDALFIVNKDGSYNYVNQRAKDMVYEGQNIKMHGDTLKHTVYYDEKGKKLTKDELPGSRVLEGEKIESVILKAKRPDKTVYYSFSGSPVYDESGKVTTAVLCFREVTGKVMYEQLLKDQRDHLYNIFEVLDLPIIRLAYPSLCISFINKHAAFRIGQMIDLENIDLENIDYQEYFTEKNIFDALPFLNSNLDYHKDILYEIEKTKSAAYSTHYKLLINEKTAYYNLVFQPILDVYHRITEIIIFGVDVTCEVEENMHIQSLMNMKDEFFSFISHEFKTPLTVINSAVQAIETLCKDELSQKAQTFIRRIKQNSYRQLRLVNNLLDITRMNAGHIKINKNNLDIVFLTKSIVDSVYLYASQKGVRLSFIPSFDHRVIGIDDEKYERILLNLLSNAIKFTEAGKSIIIKVHSKKENICIKVKDSGIGIPEDKLGHIFERFGQVDSSLSRQAEGTGIGLSLVKLFVEALGGTISVKSKIDKGTTFTMLLPAANIQEEKIEPNISQFTNNRLIQATAIEFSDIYL